MFYINILILDGSYTYILHVLQGSYFIFHNGDYACLIHIFPETVLYLFYWYFTIHAPQTIYTNASIAGYIFDPDIDYFPITNFWYAFFPFFSKLCFLFPVFPDVFLSFPLLHRFPVYPFFLLSDVLNFFLRYFIKGLIVSPLYQVLRIE